MTTINRHDRHWLRRSSFVVACLMLGAIITIGVAWVGVLVDEAYDIEADTSESLFNGWSVDNTYLLMSDHRNARPAKYREELLEPPWWSAAHGLSADDAHSLDEVDAGWPWRTMTCHWVSFRPPLNLISDEHRDAIRGGPLWETTEILDWRDINALPIGVLPLRFAASATMFGTAACVATLALSGLRRLCARRRVRRSRCPRCRHRLVDKQDRCPECTADRQHRPPWMAWLGTSLILGIAIAGAVVLATTAFLFAAADPIQPIHSAAKTGDLDRLRAELQRGVPPDLGLDGGAINPISIAIQYQHDDALDLLLDNLGTPPSSDYYFLAARMGSLGAIRVLADHGADPNGRSGRFVMAGMGVASFGDIDALWTLIDVGLVINGSPEMTDVVKRAWAERHWDVGRALSQLGSPPDNETFVRLLWDDAEGVIRAMAAGGDLCAFVERLNLGREDLWPAVYENSSAIPLLIAAGLDPNLSWGDDGTYLHAALLLEGHIETAIALVNGGADPNERRANGCTALHDAVSNHSHNLPLIRFLLEHGADPLLADDSGESPYDIAVRCNCDVEALFDRFLDRDASRPAP